MKIGFRIPQRAGTDRAVLRDAAQAIEGAGFDSAWTVEHFMWPANPDGSSAATPPIHENVKSTLQPLEVLSFVAGITERIQLGTSIMVTAYHTPLQFATRLATLDILSEGRMLAGVALGYVRAEYDHVGTPWAKRGGRMDEFIASVRAAWHEDPVTLDGEFFQSAPAFVGPKPFNGTVPLIVGGGLADAPFDRAALLGDGWLPGLSASMTPDVVVEHHHRLLERAGELGRVDPDIPLYLRVMLNLREGHESTGYWSNDIDELATQVADADRLGIDHLVLDLNHVVGFSVRDVVDRIERLAPLAVAAHG